MLETGVVKRAYELARAGAFEKVSDLFRLLKKEGFSANFIEESLSGSGIRKELREMNKAARLQSAAEPDTEASR